MPDSSNRDVAAVVLAAGASSRMPGSSKLVRAWNGTTVIASVIESARGAGLAPIGVVTGSTAGELAPHLRAPGVTAIGHAGWRRGRASTLAAGLEWATGSDRTRAVVVLLGDEPGISSDVIRAVVDAWRRSGVGLIRARYGDRPGHPVLLARETWNAARGLEGDGSVWERMEASGHPVREVRVRQAAPIDIDDPLSLAAARARLVEAPHPKRLSPGEEDR